MASAPITWIQVNSGDYSNTGNAQAFVNTLPAPMVLDPHKQYEVCCYSAWWPVRQVANSIYVNTNLVTSVMIGSEMTSSLLWIPFSEFDALPIGENFYYTTDRSRQWYPIAGKVFSHVQVTLTQSTGGGIPVNAGDYSTVTFGVREIIY
jgi:hypothetical protein